MGRFRLYVVLLGWLGFDTLDLLISISVRIRCDLARIEWLGIWMSLSSVQVGLLAGEFARYGMTLLKCSASIKVMKIMYYTYECLSLCAVIILKTTLFLCWGCRRHTMNRRFLYILEVAA